MGLGSTIESIANHIRTNSYRNETDVREAIVNRVLHDLGWDTYNPTVVRREYTVDKRRADYALFVSTNSPSVLIEVKGPNSSGEGDKQLFEYAFHQGAPFAVLVNGREWSFYLPGEQGNYVERRVQKLDLLERNSKDVASVLERYLRFDRVKSGAAHSDARADYQGAARRRDAEKGIPRAWQELLSEPDSLLIDLVAEKVVSIVGFRPTDEEIETFLLALPRPMATIGFAVQPIGVKLPEIEGIKPSQVRRVEFRIMGQDYAEADAISALIRILKTLSNRDSQFFSKFAMLAPGRTRNHISSKRSNVYPGKPDLEAYTIEVAPGWWLGTNIANREKERLVKIACGVAGLSFGKDVIVDFPNAGH